MGHIGGSRVQGIRGDFGKKALWRSLAMVALVLGLAGQAATAADYSAWQWYRTVTLTTPSNSTAQTNYPLLVRLNSNDAVWANCKSDGSDIQFTQTDGTTALSYQRAYWNSTAKAAEFWVLLPATGAASAQAQFRMYWSNSGATDASNGSGVFSSTNGYRGVWHLNGTAGSNEADATGNATDQTAATIGSPSNQTGPGGVPSSVGKGGFASGSYYKVRNSGSGSSLDFPAGGPYTIACWINPQNTNYNGGQGIIGKSWLNGSAFNGTYALSYRSGGTNLEFKEYYNGTSERLQATEPSANTWHYLVGVRNGTVVNGNSTTLALYVDGVQATGTYTALGTAPVVDHNVPFFIGWDSVAMPGSIAEVEAIGTTRNAGWAMLNYATQGPNFGNYVAMGSATMNAKAWPNAPVLAGPANNAQNQLTTLTCSWTPVTTATAYQLQVSTSSSDFSAPVYDNATITGTSQPPSGLALGTTYYWQVRASNGTDWTGWSTVQTFTTAIASPDKVSLALPGTAATLQPIVLSLSWNSVPTAITYTVQVSTDVNFGNFVFNQSGLTGLGVNTSTLANNTTYYWRVQGINGNPVPGAWSDVWSFTTILAAPAKPVLLSPQNNLGEISLTSSNLSWTSGNGAAVDNYSLQFGTDPTFATSILNVTGLTSPSQATGPLTMGATYYWRVQAVNVNPVPSAWSAVWSFKAITEDYSSGAWPNSRSITLNTSVSGANVATSQLNFPVLVRLTSANAATVFSQAKSDGSDIRFAKADGVTHLSFELNKYDQGKQLAIFWVKLDTVLGSSTTQTIKMLWGNGSASLKSDSSQVFFPANGFAGVYHFNKRSGNTYTDATGQGNTATGAASVGIDVAGGVLDSAAILHCTGGTTATAGDSIIVPGLLGSPATVTLSAWVRSDTIDQSGKRAIIMAIGDNAGFADGGVAGSATDSLWGAGHYSTGSWFNYGWPSPSLTGTSVRGLPNSAGHALWKQGWRYAAMVLNPNGTSGYMKLYINGDSVNNINVGNNPITYTAGVNTTFGKHGNKGAGNKFGGGICEARFENVARSSDWVKLSYQNQQPNDMLLSIYPLSAPTLSTPATGTANQLLSEDFAWSAVSGATSYGIQLSTDMFFSNTVIMQTGLASAGTTVSSLSAGTTYYWRTSASDAGGSSNWSQGWSFSTAAMPGTPALSAPTNNNLTGVNSTPTLSWGSVSGATSYNVRIATATDFSNPTFAQNVPGATTVAPTGLSSGVIYFWQVNANNGYLTGNWSSTWSFGTTAAWGAPPLVTPTNGAINLSVAPSFTWLPVTGATSYNLQVSTDGFGTTVAGQTGVTSTSTSVSGLSNMTNYYWQVNAFDGTQTSLWSGSWSFTTVVGAPTLAAPTNGATSQPLFTQSLSWNAANGASTYAVQVSTVSTFASTAFGQSGISATSTPVTVALAGNATYYWRVNSTGSGATGVWSSIWSFGTVPPVPSVPVLVSPASSLAAVQPLSLNLSWNTSSGTGSITYEMQIAQSSDFTAGYTDYPGLSTNSQAIGPLPLGTTYYWEVRATNSSGNSAWSSIYTFTTIEDYNQWMSHVTIPVNTAGSGGGAVIATNQVKFPLLVRLTNANAPGFGANGGSDLRFSRGSDYSKVLPYQIDYLSPTNDTASVWVNVDTVFASSANQKIMLHYGKSGIASQANGPAVFDSTTGFCAVYHMGETNPTSMSDATGHGYTGVGSASLGDTIGIIGHAKKFKNSQPDSVRIASVMGSPSAVTMSCWAKVDSIDANSNGCLLITMGDHNGLRVDGVPAGTGRDSLMAYNYSGTTWLNAYQTNSPGNHYLYRSGWKHLASVMNPSAGIEQLFVNGAMVASTPATTFTVNWAGQGQVTMLGHHANNNQGWKFGGVMDEPRIEKVVRSADWMSLSYQTQRPDQVMVGVGAPSIPVLSLPSNGAANQATALTLAWQPTTGASSFELMISDKADFSSIVNDQSNIQTVSLQVPGLAAGITYYWKVRATNMVGTTGWSSVNSFSTAMVVPALSMPADGSTDQSPVADLTWSAVNGAASYGVRISTAAAFSSTVFLQTGISGTTVAASGLATGTQYFWQANATGLGGTTSWSGASSFTTLTAAAPVLVSPVNAVPNQPTSLALSWQSAAFATSYAVQVSTDAAFGTTIIDQVGITDLSTTVSGLAKATQYYWRAGATVPGGFTSWAGGWAFTTVLNPPVLALPPTGSLGLPTTGMAVGWNAAALAESYEVQVSTDAAFATTVSYQSGLTGIATALDGVLGNATVYYWQAAAVNNGVKYWSAPFSFKTVVGAPQLASPIDGATNQPLNVSMSWVPVTGAATYEFQFSNSSSFSTTINDLPALTETGAFAGGLGKGTEYYWRVSAADAGRAGAWSAVWSFGTVMDAPALMTPANGTPGVGSALTLAWTSVNNTMSYEVQVATERTFASTFIYQKGLVDTTGSINGLAPASQYFWRANAVTLGGSNWSDVWTFTTVLNPPAMAAPANGAVAPTNLTFSWSTTALATSYEVRASADAGFGTTVFEANVPGTSAPAANLANAMTYYWQVAAVNGGAKFWSASWSFTTEVAAPDLASPANGAPGQALNPSLTWNSVAGATAYTVQVSTDAAFGSTVSSQPGLTGASATVAGLANATQYFWRAKSKNINGEGEWSPTWSFTTVLMPPILALPLNGAVSGTSVNLSWNSAVLATSYEVKISTGLGFATTVFDQANLTGLSTSVGGLANATTYYWQAAGVNSGLQYWSAVSSFTTILGAPQLALPTNNAIGQPVTLSLNWGAVNTAASYGVQVSTESGFSSTVSNQASLTAPTATVAGLANAAVYYWRTNATNGNGTGAWSPVWSFTTVLSAPVLALPSNNAVAQPLSLTMTWATVPSAATYSIQVSTDAAFGSFVASQGGLTTGSASISGLTNSVGYFWRVSSTNAGGTQWSGVWSFTTILGAPQLSLPGNNAVGQPLSLSLSWGSVITATSYEVQVSTDKGFASTVTDQKSLTALTAGVSGLANATQYFWRANASNGAGTGDWSGSWSFTTIVGPPVLATPTNGTPSLATTVTLGWSSVISATSYGWQVSTSSAFATTVANQASQTGSTATVSGLWNGTRYYWRASAANAAGSSWSAGWSFSTLVIPPALALPSNNAVGQLLSLTLSWNSLAGASTYGVKVSSDAAFATTIASQDGLTSTKAAVSGLVSGVMYYWAVNTTTPVGTSAWSGSWNFTTFGTQTIPLLAAWNMKSIYIKPFKDTTAVVFGNDTSLFFYAKDLAGNPYSPKLGEDRILHVQVGQGYQIYANKPDTLRIQGVPVDYATTPITLNTGWNMIGYLPQVADSVQHAMAGVSSSILLLKDNAGSAYAPTWGITNDLLAMYPGEGYKVLMTAAATLTYPKPTAVLSKAEAEASAKLQPLLCLPQPRHFSKHGMTGFNATALIQNVLVDGKTVADGSEIAAYDSKGNLVGSGSVLHGMADFPIWGDDPMSAKKDGCGNGEKLTFKLWSGETEYPLEFCATMGQGGSAFTSDGVLFGRMFVADGYFIKKFALSKIYPNPFRGPVKIAFDVPTLNGVREHNIQIDVFDLKGALVHQIARGKYIAGHYVLTWNASSAREGIGPGMYIVRMKAQNFDKRIKIIKAR